MCEQFQPERCDAVRDDSANILRQFDWAGEIVRVACVLQMLVGGFVCANVHSRANDM